MNNLEKFLADRKTIIGGSDVGSIVKASKWACPLKTYYSKTEEKDFDNSQKKEFRRGHRLESVAAAYYTEVTGRETQTVELVRDKGFEHLGVHMDRLISAKGKEGFGYLEIKVVGEWSFKQIKKEGAYADWISQVHYGCRLVGAAWGAIAVYWADGDELLHWDFEADRELGDSLRDAANDFWMFHVEPRLPPDPLPVGSEPCKLCEYRLTCPNGAKPMAEVAFEGVIERPDLAELARDLKESRGFGKEVTGRTDELKAEILEAIEKKPGLYRWAEGEPLLALTEVSTDRFDSKGFKAAHPDLHKKFTKTSISKTLKFTGEKE